MGWLRVYSKATTCDTWTQKTRRGFFRNPNMVNWIFIGLFHPPACYELYRDRCTMVCRDCYKRDVMRPLIVSSTSAINVSISSCTEEMSSIRPNALPG